MVAIRLAEQNPFIDPEAILFLIIKKIINFVNSLLNEVYLIKHEKKW